MSAWSHTSWTVHCDGPGCHRQVTGEDEARAKVRKTLAKRGWKVGIGAGPIRGREDFCPEHWERDSEEG